MMGLAMNEHLKAMELNRRVETVEEFKLRIAAIIRSKPEQIPAPPRPRRMKRATNRKGKHRRTSR